MPSKWRPRDPSIFPAHFTLVVLRSQTNASPALLSTHRSKLHARVAADCFREWRFCLRSGSYRAQRAWTIERDFHITLRTVVQADLFELWVEVVRRKADLLGGLNPHLASLIAES